MKELPEIISKGINSIAEDMRSGSSEILNNSLDLLAKAIELQLPPGEISGICRILAEAKPSMSALVNIMTLLAGSAKMMEGDIEEIRHKIAQSRKQCLEKARREICKDYHGKVFVTCSYSSIVKDFFLGLSREGINYEVIAIESKWKGHDFAEDVRQYCQEAGIPCMIADIKEAGSIQIDCGIIGADAFSGDNKVINGIPSTALFQLPVIICSLAESYKYSKNLHISDGFELVQSSKLKIISDNIFTF